MNKNMEIEQLLRSEIARVVGCGANEIDFSRSLGELGFDSAEYVEFASFVKAKFDVPLKPESLFEHHSVYATIDCIADLLNETRNVEFPVPEMETQGDAVAPGVPTFDARDVAIIGASARLPGATDLASLWDLIVRGTSKLSAFPVEREVTVDRNVSPQPYLRGGFIDDADAFDAAFFGISPREALAMDPQQRISLETAWHAFEDAGYNLDRLSGSDTAVFVGASSFDYYELLTATKAARTTHIGTGVSHAIIANRLSQYFNLKGASEAIDTACASSLVAIIRGVNAIRQGDSRVVLAGGVNLLASRTPFQVFADAGMLSQEGVCRPFDDAAAGYVRGEGAGFVVLKQAQAALQDGDRILAIIKGGAVQHSGRTQSLTAPNPEAQANVIVAAMEDARIDPASIGYVEAHGTGTALGDPIEVLGLNKAFARTHEKFGRSNAAPHFSIGSIKAQIGHLEAAAGVAGVLKAICALSHRAIPGSPYLNQINRHIAMNEAVFRISQSTIPWNDECNESRPAPRRAGVSSFGFGGTNSHIVLEEAPRLPSRSPVRSGPRLFLFSAKSDEALRMLCGRFALALEDKTFAESAAEQMYLDDVAFTLRHGRSALGFRLATLASSVAELSVTLRSIARDGTHTPGVYVGEIARECRKTQEPAIEESSSQHAVNAEIVPNQNNLTTLATSWVAGALIDWESVLPRGAATLVSLPHYPFARERFWVRSEEAKNISEVVPQTIPTTGSAAAFYKTRWSPTPLAASRGSITSLMDGKLLVLTSGLRGQRVADVMHRLIPQNPMMVIYCPSAEKSDPRSIAEGMSSPYGAVLDLTPLDEVAYLDMAVPMKLALLRHLIGPALKRGEVVRIVHATRGLQDIGKEGVVPSTLAGAQDAGFYEHLSAEYKHCQSKTVDFSVGSDDAEAIARHLMGEMRQYDGHRGIAYVGEQRYARVMERVAVPQLASTSSYDEIGSVLITGGTGDIGLCLARDLVEHGCRALLLTGRSALPPEKSAYIDQLVQRGTRIAFYRGELTDAAALREAVDNFRVEQGQITHVFHCAGVADKMTPAFYQKTAESIARVMEPKVQALEVLHELFLQNPPRHFVLFSSVSSVAPKSAAGVLDYAAANRFLDLFAHFQHAQGRTYYRAIQWTRWENLGLAKQVTLSVDGSGRPLPAQQCLQALHAILIAGDALPASVCVLADGDPILETQIAVEKVKVDATPAVQKKTNVAQSDLRFDAMRNTLRVMVAKELETPESKLDDKASFEELGIDSIVLMGLISAIENWLGVVVEPQELIDRNSIEAVADYLWSKLTPEAIATIGTTTVKSQQPTQEVVTTRSDESKSSTKKVAVIGMACRFPGANGKEAFWHNLQAGIASVGPIPASRWDKEKIYAPRHEVGRSISQAGGFIDDIEWVNPKLFGMNTEDAADIDPLVRLFTECSMEAASDSARGVDGIKGQRVGVFVGARTSGYAERIEHPGKHSVTGIGQNFISAHVTHLLDLRGPSLVIDSACSSSLAAIHLACQSILCGDSEMALAGGVEVLLDEKPYLFLSAAHALSPDGQCRPFDARANGFVPGEGVGCVLLKPLERALADGDPIYAVIEGSAMNNDGHTLGITTPGVPGQVDVIERALRNAGLAPSAISYVEAHGTGTLIGDPIELQALARAFQSDPPKRCGVGSVKSNVGHLMSAAGVASFIKVALALHHRAIPPSLNCNEVNPRFDFERTPFYLARTLQQWDGQGEEALRRAGISAFGFGKTNVHVVLGEAPAMAARPQDRATQFVDAKAGKVRAWHGAVTSPVLDPVDGGTSLLDVEIEFFEELEIMESGA